MARDNQTVVVNAKIVPIIAVDAYIVLSTKPLSLVYLRNYLGDFIFNYVGSKITVGS